MNRWKFADDSKTVVSHQNDDGSGESCLTTAIQSWIAAGNAVLPADLPAPPTPIQQIRALEQAHDDDQRKLNRQAALSAYIDEACRNPLAAGKTRDEVKVYCYATNRGYRATVDLEVQCAALRKLIV